ncbi:ABC transporter [Microdochium trichocladiopsis]|uniref:ABC transporter n=1 Tax=Microdochium trichocladiopsis TaxID=1682393 RepID=A0A9P9BQ81_9PEZI|nr:ABC transporter [Microdochium trichocladiopsis]KAH7030662.1 ABC transporter [Microdochium trichocladiopsis]
MPSTRTLLQALLLGVGSCAANPLVASNSGPEVETRTLEEIHQAALKEGGIVTLWHGGDETTQQNTLKQAFEARFPGMTLNSTVDLSKYHDAALDEQLANNNVYVDSIILQTVQDYPRWNEEGALLQYAPLGFNEVAPAYKDSLGATYYGVAINGWKFIVNTNKSNVALNEWEDFLNPELKDKLVLTYPNDDDAVLWAFDLILERYGTGFFDRLLAQNPRWVRGTATPSTILRQANSTYAATFTSGGGFVSSNGVNFTLPTQGPFVTWAQTAAILKDAPHPEGAKLLHGFLLSTEWQQPRGWSVRRDVPLPANFPFGELDDNKNTNAGAFMPFMVDRARVGRLKDWLESKIGTPQGLSPLKDGI